MDAASSQPDNFGELSPGSCLVERHGETPGRDEEICLCFGLRISFLGGFEVSPRASLKNDKRDALVALVLDTWTVFTRSGCLFSCIPWKPMLHGPSFWSSWRWSADAELLLAFALDLGWARWWKNVKLLPLRFPARQMEFCHMLANVTCEMVVAWRPTHLPGLRHSDAFSAASHGSLCCMALLSGAHGGDLPMLSSCWPLHSILDGLDGEKMWSFCRCASQHVKWSFVTYIYTPIYIYYINITYSN